MDEKPPCPCCADRASQGALFKLRGPPPLNACGECLESVVEDVDGPALLEEILSQSPVRLRWDLSAAQVDALGKAMVARSKAAIDAVVAAHASGAALTWEMVGAVLCLEDAEFSVIDSSCTFPGHVSTDKGLRDACTAADTEMSAYAVASNSRKDLYAAIVAYSQTEEAKGLSGERKRYVERRLRDGRRMGLDLDDETAGKVKDLNTRISALGIQFAKSLGEEAATFDWGGADLDGLPTEWLAERAIEGQADR